MRQKVEKLLQVGNSCFIEYQCPAEDLKNCGFTTSTHSAEGGTNPADENATPPCIGNPQLF